MSDLTIDSNSTQGQKSMFLKAIRSRFAKRTLWLGVALIGLVIVMIDVFKIGSIPLPQTISIPVMPVDQGWKSGWEVGQSQWFHHADQGTKILNYDWFLALDQPELSVFTRPGKFSDPVYLQRFGFIPSMSDQEMNPNALPVGFAVNRSFQEPQEGASLPYPAVGLTCAACHTGQINYRGKALRIDGGSGMVDLGKFKAALGRAIFYTRLFPWRFDRFARAALGERYNAETKAQLRKEVDAFLAKAKKEKDFADRKGIYALESGFSRTDALGLILNRVFDQVNPENISVVDAPVNFPHIWDAPWFDWVQYNASIRTPMARNIGEVLGVGGMVNLPGTPGKNWKSTVNITNLHLMEKQLAGDAPFQGLQSPKWPEEVLGKLNPDLVRRGAELFTQKRCHYCHWRSEDMQAALASENGQASADLPRMWTRENRHHKRFVNTTATVQNVEFIGTDAAAAINFARRVVVIRNGVELSAAGGRLDELTNYVREDKYQELGLLDASSKVVPEKKELLLAYDGYRVPWNEYRYEKLSEGVAEGKADERTIYDIETEIDSQRDSFVRLGYKARPLNGIWATAPYLHNGSVRNLYQLLSPVAERDRSFNLGSKEFDPQQVGYIDEPVTGGFVMDTKLPGNRNTGHEFRDLKPDPATGRVPRVKGVLGTGLSQEERMALIEYLKSL